MAFRTGIRQSRELCTLTSGLKSKPIFNTNHVASSYRFNHGKSNGENNHGSNEEVNWKLAFKFGAVAGMTVLALGNSVVRKDLLADEKPENDAEQEVIDKENRMRQYSRLTTMFDYFATYEIIKSNGMFFMEKQLLQAVLSGLYAH